MKKQIFAISLGFLVAAFGLAHFALSPSGVNAASFENEFTVRPSRLIVNGTPEILIKAQPPAANTATEDRVDVEFDANYTVTPGSLTVTTTDVALWDATCTAWPGITVNAGNSSATVASFDSGALTASTTYCFIITAGVTNPATAGNYPVTVTSFEAGPTAVDTNTLGVPTIDDDQVVINATVSPYINCDVTTTAGADNEIDLGNLTFGSVTTSTDDIELSVSTNAADGAKLYLYGTGDGTDAGLYSSTSTYLMEAANAEDTIAASTTSCSATDPCFGVYHNGTTSATTGTIAPNADFDGGGANDVGPMITSSYGVEVAQATATVPNVVADATIQYDVKATAAQDTPTANDYQETLTFTCQADI